MKQILNIFSKSKPATEKNSGKVIIDYREKNSLVPSELINLGLNIEVRELKVADYLVNDVAIERKTVSDFTSSMINKRLLSQLKGLQQYKERILIIEGIYEQELYSDKINPSTGTHPNSIRGFIISIILKYKTPIIFTKDYRDTAKFILVLSKRKEKESSLNVFKKTLNKKERMQFILEGFPSIGPKTAKKLLEKFKTIKNIINSSEEELKQVIGKKAEILKKLINEEY